VSGGEDPEADLPVRVGFALDFVTLFEGVRFGGIVVPRKSIDSVTDDCALFYFIFLKKKIAVAYRLCNSIVKEMAR